MNDTTHIDFKKRILAFIRIAINGDFYFLFCLDDGI